MTPPSHADAVARALAATPRIPSDFDLFSSNVLFGEPGIYPQGSPMVPATGDAPTAAEAASVLAELGIAGAADRVADASLVARVPDAGVRAGLVALTVTVGEPLVAAFVRGDTPVESLRYGEPASPGRIVGPPAGAAGASPQRVVNVRYRAEHPALLAGSLAHDLLWNPEHAGPVRGSDAARALRDGARAAPRAGARSSRAPVPSSRAARTRSRSRC